MQEKRKEVVENLKGKVVEILDDESGAVGEAPPAVDAAALSSANS